jgi:hypothetical protein
VVNGLGGNDTVLVDTSNGNPLPLANVLVFNGGRATIC